MTIPLLRWEAPGPYEVLFPSAAHSESDVEKTVEAVREVVRA